MKIFLLVQALLRLRFLKERPVCLLSLPFKKASFGIVRGLYVLSFYQWLKSPCSLTAWLALISLAHLLPIRLVNLCSPPTGKSTKDETPMTKPWWMLEIEAEG